MPMHKVHRLGLGLPLSSSEGQAGGQAVPSTMALSVRKPQLSSSSSLPYLHSHAAQGQAHKVSPVPLPPLATWFVGGLQFCLPQPGRQPGFEWGIFHLSTDGYQLSLSFILDLWL